MIIINRTNIDKVSDVTYLWPSNTAYIGIIWLFKALHYADCKVKSSEYHQSKGSLSPAMRRACQFIIKSSATDSKFLTMLNKHDVLTHIQLCLRRIDKELMNNEPIDQIGQDDEVLSSITWVHDFETIPKHICWQNLIIEVLNYLPNKSESKSVKKWRQGPKKKKKFGFASQFIENKWEKLVWVCGLSKFKMGSWFLLFFDWLPMYQTRQ